MHMYNSRLQHHAFKYAASQIPNRYMVYVFSYKSDFFSYKSEFSIESAEVQLAVSGGQALFTLGLPKLALPL